MMLQAAGCSPSPTDHRTAMPFAAVRESGFGPISNAPLDAANVCNEARTRRRLELLEWAGDTGAWIVEDDYNSEYRYTGRPLAALQGLDQGRRVIYVGTFSKVMFPALRLSYIVVPEALVDAFSRARATTDFYTSVVAQAAVAAFIEEGYFSSHIRRMRQVYLRRRDLLREEVSKHLGGAMTVDCPAAGMHAIARLERWLEQIGDQAISRLGAEAPCTTVKT